MRGTGAPLLALAVAAWIAGCGSESRHSRLVLTGSSTVAPLMAEVSRRFEQSRAGVRIDVQTGGSARGITDVRQKVADVGMVSRAPRADETDLQWFPIALDGVVLVVHGDNPVRALSTQQVRDIYCGRIERWSELGGLDADIHVVHKAEGRSTLEVFLEHLGVPNHEIRPDVIAGDNQQVVKTLLGDPAAIGYVSIGAALLEQRSGALRMITLDGVVPTLESVRTGRLPMVRTLHLVTAEMPTGLARDLIEFSSSDEVRDLVEKLLLVPNGS